MKLIAETPNELYSIVHLLRGEKETLTVTWTNDEGKLEGVEGEDLIHLITSAPNQMLKVRAGSDKKPKGFRSVLFHVDKSNVVEWKYV